MFVDTPLEVCEQRDPKGLYKKARGGQLPANALRVYVSLFTRRYIYSDFPTRVTIRAPAGTAPL